MASFNVEEHERRRRQMEAQKGFADLAKSRRERFGGDGLGGPAPASTGVMGPPDYSQQRTPMAAPATPNVSQPKAASRLDPVEVRAQQNRLLAQQRGVDEQIRALRRKRARGQELSPEEIKQLATLEQQAVDLRRNKVDAFRLGNELEGRGPLSAQEAEASRMRLSTQVAEARRRVMGQAESELDANFDRQIAREQAGIPNYRPEGMPDANEIRLREEMAGPGPAAAQRQFLEATAVTDEQRQKRDEQRQKREARMAMVRQAEMERQARMVRERGIAGTEADAALDAREVRAAIPEIEAQNEVAAARNRGQAAEVESRGLTLAESEINQRIDEIDGLGSQEISARASELEAIIAENRQRASAATGDTAVEFRRRTQSAEAELAALKAEEDLRVTKDQIDRVRSGMSSGEFSFTTPGERADAAAMWLRTFEGGEDASGNSMPGFVGKSLHGRTGADVVGSMRTLVEILDAVDPLQKPEAAQAISTRLREVYGGGNGWMVLSAGTRRSWRGARVDSSSVNNWNQVAAQTAKVMEMGGERQPIVYVTHGVNGGTYAIGSNGKSVRVTSGQGLSDQAAKSHREKVYGTSST